MKERGVATATDDDDEVIWATSMTGEDFQCVHVQDWREARARIAEIEAALKSVVDVWYGADREKSLPDVMDVAFRALRKPDPK